MIIGIQGSRNFNDYSIFLNAMLRVMQDLQPEDNELVFLSVGPHKVNDMIMEFINVANWNRGDRVIKPKLVKMPVKALEERVYDLDEFVYLCLPKEPETHLVEAADNAGLIPRVFRY